MKALTRDREDRYRSVAELADHIRAYLAGHVDAPAEPSPLTTSDDSGAVLVQSTGEPVQSYDDNSPTERVLMTVVVVQVIVIFFFLILSR